MMRKAIIFLNTCVDRLVLIFATVALLVCSYATYDAIMVYYHANDTGILKYKPGLGSDAEVLRELSSDVVAWLTLDGTKIDYPVMQGKNNTEYINKDPYGDFSLSGSIFLDSRNGADFSDPYSLLYGHHMEYGAMFGALDEYLQKDYLESHKTGLLTTVNDESYSIRIFASMLAPANQKEVFSPDESTSSELLSYAAGHASVFDQQEATSDCKILALSTCTTGESLDRTVVLGTLSPAGVLDGGVSGEVLA